MTKTDLKSLWYLKHALKHNPPDTEEKREKMAARIKAIEEWVEKIDDPLVRDIVEYRFVRGWRWAKVAVTIGGGNTEDGIRMLVNRYIQRDKERNRDEET